jgi:hypothetical protein
VERQCAKEERNQAKKPRAEELAAARALKKQQRDAVTSQKSYDTPNKAKPKASHSAAKSPTKRRCVVSARSQPEAALEPPLPTPQTTRKRPIRRPKKYSE